MKVNALARGRPGFITLEDRSDDKTLIVLLGEEGPAAGEPTGTVLAPTAARGDDDDNDTWITFSLKAMGGGDPFRIRIDTTDLPGGAAFFETRAFVERCRTEAEQTGDATHVRLTVEDVEGWGLRRTAISGSPDFAEA